MNSKDVCCFALKCVCMWKRVKGAKRPRDPLVLTIFPSHILTWWKSTHVFIRTIFIFYSLTRDPALIARSLGERSYFWHNKFVFSWCVYIQMTICFVFQHHGFHLKCQTCFSIYHITRLVKSTLYWMSDHSSVMMYSCNGRHMTLSYTWRQMGRM